MDFDFLIQATKEHPKILDNIGIINIWFKKKLSNSENNVMVEESLTKKEDVEV